MARPTKQPHEKRTERFNLRYTVAELAHIEAQAELAGMTPTEFLRQRGLDYAVKPAPGQADAALISQLNRIGQNVNQIARNTNSGRQLRIDAEAAMAELRGVLEQVAASYGA